MAAKREGFHNWLVQLPKSLWEALNREAEREERTATAQLAFILKQRYPEAAPPPRPRGRPKKGSDQ
jgi:hypothetical protein